MQEDRFPKTRLIIWEMRNKAYSTTKMRQRQKRNGNLHERTNTDVGAKISMYLVVV